MPSQRQPELATQMRYLKLERPSADAAPILKEQYLLKGLNKAILALLNHTDTEKTTGRKQGGDIG